MRKGQKQTSGRSNTRGSENIITNGSVIAVADGQCMILVDQGKVTEFCAEPGEFTYDSSTEPSLFSGSLGSGWGGPAILLLLSMAQREFALFRYGEKAVYAFNDYGVEQLEEAFLDNFGSDDWYGGFESYVRKCGRYLEKAAAGKPHDHDPHFLGHRLGDCGSGKF